MQGYWLLLRKRILLPVLGALTLATWLVFCLMHYENYWHGTIYHVQTTDFNLLHHTLPGTVSQMILTGKDELVQDTLDSSYGLFGLVVTDPSGETILYKTEKVYHRRSWQNRAVPEILAKESEPYDLLTDPPLLEPLHAYASPRAKVPTKYAIPKGVKVLGRLYYLRSVPPTFGEDLGGFLAMGFCDGSGARRGYFYITLNCVGFSLVILLLIYLRKRGLELKQKELEHIKRELDIRRRALEHLTGELNTQKARKLWLEREADQAYKRAFALRASLERLRDAMAEISDGSVDFNPVPGAVSKEVQMNSHVKIRPPVSPPAAIFEEIEALIPGLTGNAQALRSQALQMQDYCLSLEERQEEMKRILQKAFDHNPLGSVNGPLHPLPDKMAPDALDMSAR